MKPYTCLFRLSPLKSQENDVTFKVKRSLLECNQEHVLEKCQKTNIHHIMSVYCGLRKTILLLCMSSNLLNIPSRVQDKYFFIASYTHWINFVMYMEYQMYYL